MTRRLVLTYLSVTVFALAIVVIPLGSTFAGRERDRLLFQIERDAQVVASQVEEDLEAGQRPKIDPLLQQYRSTGGRIVVVIRSGASVADSDHIGAPTENFASRPEIVTALAGDRAAGSRPSATAGTDLLYVAIPVVSSATVYGAVRLTYPSSTLDARVRSTWLRLGALSALVIVMVAAAGVLLARSVTRPVRRLRTAAAALAAGDAEARVPTNEGPPELRDLAETFNVTADRLARLLESQRRFVADASHQLRTPLTAMRLRLETLAASVAEDDRPKLDAAVREVERLGLLVQTLLTLARLDSAPHELRPVDLVAVIDERVETWTEVARDQSVELLASHDERMPVLAVHGAVEQILDNLIANALEVSTAGAHISIVACRAGIFTDLHIIDEGPGMTDVQRAHAFERFWRSPTARGNGFGLGLSIVDQLARASGGAARLDVPKGGRGLDVVVRFRSAAIEPSEVDGIANPALTST